MCNVKQQQYKLNDWKANTHRHQKLNCKRMTYEGSVHTHTFGIHNFFSHLPNSKCSSLWVLRVLYNSFVKIIFLYRLVFSLFYAYSGKPQKIK